MSLLAHSVSILRSPRTGANVLIRPKLSKEAWSYVPIWQFGTKENELSMKTEKVIKKAHEFAKPFCVTHGDNFRLKHIDPGDTLGLQSEAKPRAKEAFANGHSCAC